MSATTRKRRLGRKACINRARFLLSVAKDHVEPGDRHPVYVAALNYAFELLERLKDPAPL